MTKKEKQIKEAGDIICRWHKKASTDDPWENLHYKQGLYDALTIMKKCKLIADWSFETGVVMPTNNGDKK